MTQPTLEWSIAKVDQKLRIDYTITNNLPQKIYVANTLIEPKGNDNFVRVDQPVVQTVLGAPGLVLVGLGAFSSSRPSTVVFQPIFNPLEAGKSLTGHLLIAVPLSAYNPVGGADPIPASANKMSLRITYFKGEPSSWKTMPSKEKNPIKVPDGFTTEMLQSEPKPLP
jgi:hypothetical protein